MFKKGILIGIFCMFLNGISFAHSQVLNYGELLSLYFGVVTQKRNLPKEKPLLKYTNLKPSNPLYQLLQIAVANGKFPNLETALPLEKPALESDLALLVNQNFDYHLPITSGSQLSFDFLKNSLQKLYTNFSKEPNPEPLSEATKSVISSEIIKLLKTNFIHKEHLQNLETPSYEELSTFVKNIQDRYTQYYRPQEGKNFMDTLKSSFGGVGIYLKHQETEPYPKVIKLINKSPAQKAGIQAQDEIIAVNGKPFSAYQDFDTFVRAMKGEQGSRVELQIKRGEQFLNFQLIREHIQIPMLQSHKSGSVCYFRIHSFDLGSHKRFSEEVIKQLPCVSFVFDLRGNPGGVVDEVVEILESFIPKGKPILTIASPEKQEVINAKNQNFFPLQMPTAILIDESTASAAEIFAGVLKHYYPDVVKLIGEKSYGKGSVQEVVEFSEHSLLKYTIALWNIADQKDTIDQKGLVPDLVMHDNPSTPQDEILEFLGITLEN